MTDVNPPFALLAEVTHRCPMACPYCSNPLELVRRGEELATDVWADVFQQAADMGCLQLHLSGGEPAARKDLVELVAASEGAGLYTNLITSGLLIDQDRVKALADVGLSHIQLSIQDSDETLSDFIGGSDGSWAHKRRLAGWVTGAEIALTVNTVLHRQNLHHLEAIIDQALDMGAQRLELAHTQYYGWGIENRAALIPTRDMIDGATEIAEAAIERLRGRLQIDYVTPDYYGMRPKPCMGGWGQRFLTVTPRGQVWPCHAAGTIPGLEFDNVADRPLADIWQTSQAFNAYRGTDWLPEPCQSCDRKEIDWGGCRCQALALAGDAGAVDPVCELAPGHGEIADVASSESGADPPDFRFRRFS